MQYGLIETPTLEANEALVLGVFANSTLDHIAKELDKKTNGLIHRLLANLVKRGDWVWQGDLNGHPVMLIHCGNEAEFNIAALNQCLNEVTGALIKQRIKSATICLPNIIKHSPDRQVEQMILKIDAKLYQSLAFKTQNKTPHSLESLQFYLPQATSHAVKSAQSIAEGIAWTRTLADLPANICTPTYLGEEAIKFTQQHDLISTKILGPEEMKTMGMGALLAVAQGSSQEPRFIEINYCGGGDSKPVVLVGKGITFDSGGLCLKPANVMDEMKYDMSGAATVLGVIKACVLLNLPINLVGIISSAENMMSGSATRPGDIVTSMSGQTIEIVNTDAEGRLVLADALTYAERLNPLFVIDIATLTGAMVVALGYLTTGFMTQDEELAAKLIAAGEEADDKIWRMPLSDDYQDALDSPMADMINGGFDRAAGSIVAACFLSRFTKQYPWAHLDVAGTAWVSGKKRQATGRPVHLLVQLLRHATGSY